jgi:type III secretory pathway lipoprotein EscJ
MLGARVRAQLQRAGRTWRGQSPPLRWGLAAAALALLGAAAYLSAPAAAPSALVKGGQAFTPDDLLKIEPELQRKRIAYRVDDGRHVVVAADAVTEANDVVQKLGAGTRALDDILRDGQVGGLFEPPVARQERALQAKGAYLSEVIRRLPDSGIVTAHVQIQMRPTRDGMRTTTQPTAFVLLETERNRVLRFQVIKTIEEMIVGSEPGMKPDAITIFDQGGHHYVDARKPEVREQTHIRAREEELGEKILERIDHIKGVQVTVQLVPVTPPKAEPEPAPGPEAQEEPEPAKAARGADLLPPPIAVNQPVEIAPEPAPAPEPEPKPRPKPAPAKPAPAKPAPTDAPGMLARVWVKVPRSWYLRAHPSPSPSTDELRKSREETERQIHTAVEHTIPPGEASEVKIDTIADELPARPKAPVPVAPVAREARWVWLLTGVLAGVAVTLVPLGLHLAAARRPAPRPARGADLGWFHVDETGEAGPGPSERVRELIRLNPEAAASVLTRWTGQGGPVE